MIAAMRLRGSNAGSARGAASLLAQASKQSSPTSSTPPLAHLPSGHFDANAAWAVCAALAHNLLRAAGSLTSAFHAKARGATLRTHLVCVPTCPNTGPGPKTGSPCTPPPAHPPPSDTPDHPPARARPETNHVDKAGQASTRNLKPSSTTTPTHTEDQHHGRSVDSGSVGSKAARRRSSKASVYGWTSWSSSR
jgi:hypothetical protein